nr:uncharacterized protein LOC115259281 [Aedes albopictus]
MREQVQDHIKSCVTCIAYNPRNKRYDGVLNNVDKPAVPFKVLHIDHLVHLREVKGNEYVLAVVDACTKFIKLDPTKTTKTTEVMKSLRNYFHALGPAGYNSDRGTAFTSNAFENFVKDHGVKHVK